MVHTGGVLTSPCVTCHHQQTVKNYNGFNALYNQFGSDVRLHLAALGVARCCRVLLRLSR